MSIFNDVWSFVKKTYFGLNAPMNPYYEIQYQLEKIENPSSPDIRQGVENISKDISIGVEKSIIQPTKKFFSSFSTYFKYIIIGIGIGILLYFGSLFFRKK